MMGTESHPNGPFIICDSYHQWESIAGPDDQWALPGKVVSTFVNPIRNPSKRGSAKAKTPAQYPFGIWYISHSRRKPFIGRWVVNIRSPGRAIQIHIMILFMPQYNHKNKRLTYFAPESSLDRTVFWQFLLLPSWFSPLCVLFGWRSAIHSQIMAKGKIVETRTFGSRDGIFRVLGFLFYNSQA